MEKKHKKESTFLWGEADIELHERKIEPVETEIDEVREPPTEYRVRRQQERS